MPHHPSEPFADLPRDVQDHLADWPLQRAHNLTQKEATMPQPPTTVDWRDLSARLAEPFPDELIKYRVGAISKDKKRAQALPYVDPRSYEDRLNELVPGGWSVEFTPWGENRVICRLTIHGVTRSSTGDGAGSPDSTAGMTAESQSLRRACSKYGLGRHLYDLEALWVPYNATTKTLQIPPPPKRREGHDTRQRREQPSEPKHPTSTQNGEGRLGQARAATMHRELAQLGFPREEHRTLAGRILGRTVANLASLTQRDAARIWRAAQRGSPSRTAHGANRVREG